GIQFRYYTIPDPGYALINLISSRAEQGTHTLASLLQAANLEFLESSAKLVPYRRSVLTMWVRVPGKKRINSTMSALSDFKHAMREHVKANGVITALRRLPEIYRRTADDAVVRRTLEEEKRNYNHANRVWRQIENSSPLMLRRFTRQEIWEAVFLGHSQNASAIPMLPERLGRDLRDYLCGE